MNPAEADDWFVQEVLPLEPALVRYLRRNWRDENEIPDLRQEVYARVYDKALVAIPAQAKPFVFMTARNLIIDRVRRSRVVSIEAVAEMDDLNVTADDLTPDRVASAREELRRLQAALDLLPPKCREVVALRKIEALLQAGARVRVHARELHPQLVALQAQGRLERLEGDFDEDWLAQARLLWWRPTMPDSTRGWRRWRMRAACSSTWSTMRGCRASRCRR